MSTLWSNKRTHQNFAQCQRNSRWICIFLFSPTSTEEQPSAALMKQCTQLPKIWILFRSSRLISTYNFTYAHEGMAGCSSFRYSERLCTKKMNTHSYENPWLSNKQDCISYTEIARFLISCEHQLSFSPQHNFQIIEKNGRKGKGGETRGRRSQSAVQTPKARDCKSESVILSSRGCHWLR